MAITTEKLAAGDVAHVIAEHIFRESADLLAKSVPVSNFHKGGCRRYHPPQLPAHLPTRRCGGFSCEVAALPPAGQPVLGCAGAFLLCPGLTTLVPRSPRERPRCLSAGRRHTSLAGCRLIRFGGPSAVRCDCPPPLR